MNARLVIASIFSLLLLTSSVFGEVDEYHVNLDGNTEVFQTQSQADAYVKERGYDQYPVDHEASRAAQAKADAEFQAQRAQLDAQMQQKAVEMGTAITVNDLDTGQTKIYGTPTLPDGSQTYHPGGTALRPSPTTLGGETVGLSGFAPIEPGKLNANGIPDGYVLVNGTLVKEAPKEEWPTERIEKARQNIAEGLAKYKEQINAEGRQVSDDEARLAAARLDVQNRVYSNPDYKPTATEIEKEAIKQAAEWKQNNTYMMSDGRTVSFGPGGVAGWVQDEIDSREKFLRETRAMAEGVSKGVTPGLTPQEQATEDGARTATLKSQAELEKSMREDSEKKIAEMLKETGQKDPRLSKTSTVPQPKVLISYEKDKQGASQQQ